jgi:hypothetical protein
VSGEGFSSIIFTIHLAHEIEGVAGGGVRFDGGAGILGVFHGGKAVLKRLRKCNWCG